MSINHDTWPRWTAACPDYVVPWTTDSESEAEEMAKRLNDDGKCGYDHHAVKVNSQEEFRAMRQRRIYAESTKEEGENT